MIGLLEMLLVVVEIRGDFLKYKFVNCSECDSNWPVSTFTKDYICPDCYIRLSMNESD